MEYCSKCNGETKFLKGISKKTGKPYQGFRCVEPDCGNMDFIKDELHITKEVREVITPKEKELDYNIRSMLMAYAKDLVVAQIQSEKYSSPLGIEEIISAYKQMTINL